MKTKLYSLVILISLFFSINEKGYSQIPKWEWAGKTGGRFNNVAHNLSVDVSGNVYTGGSFQGTVDFDPGNAIFNLTSVGGNDIFISKFDSSLNCIWAKQIGGIDDEGINWIKVDTSGNIYATGGFHGTVDFDPGPGIYNLTGIYGSLFILKLDSAGNFLWAKAITGWYLECKSIALDASGNFYMTGTFRTTVDFNPGSGTFNLTSAGDRDIYILKLNSTGHFVWAKRMGGTGDYEYGNSIAVDEFENVYTSGPFRDIADFDPGPGTFNLNANYGSTFISKLNSSGNFVWAKQLGDSGTVVCNSTVVDLLGNVYFTGSFLGKVDFDPGPGTYQLNSGAYNTYDIFILKLDTAANFVWAKRIGGSIEYENATSISLDAFGNVYITGSFASHKIDFDPDTGIFNLKCNGNAIFITKLDPTGNFIYAKSAPASKKHPHSFEYVQSGSIVIGANGQLYLTGYFTVDSINFENITLTYNYNPCFIAKLTEKPCSTITCNINPTVKIDRVSNHDCNNGKITVNLGGTFQAFPHVELCDSLNTIISSVNVSSGILHHQFNHLAPGSYTVKVFDNNCCEQDIPALVHCSSLTTGLKTTNIKTTSAKLKWNVASCVVSDRVQYRVQGTTAWTNRHLSSNQGYRTIVNLVPSTTYEWRVANMCNGFSGYPHYSNSPIQTFTTLALREGDESLADFNANESFEINLYPNPATYTLTVNFETENATAKLKVINTVGQIVFEKQLQSDDGSYKEQLDISKYNNGMYVLLVETENGVSRKKFAKE